MKRFYVTMTWDDFPEGGSYGTVVEAEDHEEAEKLCRLEMAQIRVEGGSGDGCTAEEYPTDDWHLIDCGDLDEFIARHHKPTAAIVERLDAFNRQCVEAEHTPTDEVWDLLDWIRQQLTGKSFPVGDEPGAPEA
jgi:hypothetical protein